MKCPYCQQEMKEGLLGSGHSILWTRERGEAVVGTGSEGFRIGKGFWSGCYAESHYCPDCNVIITPNAKRSKES